MGRKPRVFMDLSINKTAPQRILFYDGKPKTAENFRALCTGEKGIGKTTGKPLHYKGTKFFSIFRNRAAAGGDFENNDGTGGESIYGGNFETEGSSICEIFGVRSGPGILMTISHGSSATTGSQFLLCFKQSRAYLEGSNVAFGRVVEGLETLSQLEHLQEYELIEITDCGEVSEGYVDEPQSGSDSKEGYTDQSFNEWLLTKHIGTCEDPPINLDEMSESQKAEILKLKQLFKKRPNMLPIIYIRPPSNPHQHSDSDDTSKSRDVQSPILWNRSKKSESPVLEDKKNNVTESDKELKNEVSRLQHDLALSMSESHKLNAEISELKRVVEELRNQAREVERKRSNTKVDWPVIAASAGAVILAGVAYFCHGKYRVVYRQHCNHCNH